MRLNELKDNPGARKKGRRVGRGIGSGRGKTSSRGHKGAKARSGGSKFVFEGGQTPIYRRLPKRGSNGPVKKFQIRPINLSRLEAAIQSGRLCATENVSEDSLFEAGLLSDRKFYVKILGSGEISSRVRLFVAFASESARRKVEAAGGSIVTYGKGAFRLGSVGVVGEERLPREIEEGRMRYQIRAHRGEDKSSLHLSLMLTENETDFKIIDDLSVILFSDALPEKKFLVRLGKIKAGLDSSGKNEETIQIETAANQRTVSGNFSLFYKDRMVQNNYFEVPIS